LAERCRFGVSTAGFDAFSLFINTRLICPLLSTEVCCFLQESAKQDAKFFRASFGILSALSSGLLADTRIVLDEGFGS